MPCQRFRFDEFLLDCDNRRLTRGGTRVELNARYLDALILLVREADALVSKDRFLADIWRGVPVTDEALTQCIRALRRRLGDDAARPRFIETVPKHGYRFVAAVSPAGREAAAAESANAPRHARRGDVAPLAVAGTLGAGLAGLIGGLGYGFIAASRSPMAGGSALSALLVLTCLTILVALVGGGAVALGIALGSRARDRRGPWIVAGGAGGGLTVGAIAKLLGLDAFALLLGHAPGDITGAAEGAVLGGAVGLGAWLATQGAGRLALRRGVSIAMAIGAAAGATITIAGGRLMGGSLDLLARSFPDSRLRLDGMGDLFGENGFGPITRIASGAIEGALFCGCIVGALILARRQQHPPA